MGGGKLPPAQARPVESDVVGMDVHQSHAATPGYPIKLSFPDVRGGLLEDEEQGGILREGVRQFHVATTTLAGNPEGKDGMNGVWLRFKGISVKRGGIILYVQFTQPVQIVEHETGAKTAGPPFLQVTVDAAGLFAKIPPHPVIPLAATRSL